VIVIFVWSSRTASLFWNAKYKFPPCLTKQIRSLVVTAGIPQANLSFEVCFCDTVQCNDRKCDLVWRHFYAYYLFYQRHKVRTSILLLCSYEFISKLQDHTLISLITSPSHRSLLFKNTTIVRTSNGILNQLVIEVRSLESVCCPTQFHLRLWHSLLWQEWWRRGLLVSRRRPNIVHNKKSIGAASSCLSLNH